MHDVKATISDLNLHPWLYPPGRPSKAYVHFSFPEPGYYEDNEFGIRIEDIVMVVKADTKVKLVKMVVLQLKHSNQTRYFGKQKITINTLFLERIKTFSIFSTIQSFYAFI